MAPRTARSGATDTKPNKGQTHARQRPSVRARSHRASVTGIVVSIAVSACCGRWRRRVRRIDAHRQPAIGGATGTVPPTGTKSFGATSERNLALPLYGISLPFAAVVAPGSIIAGRRLEAITPSASPSNPQPVRVARRDSRLPRRRPSPALVRCGLSGSPRAWHDAHGAKTSSASAPWPSLRRPTTPSRSTADSRRRPAPDRRRERYPMSAPPERSTSVG